MPWEADALKDVSYPKVRCPKCNTYPLTPFMRGQVQRARKWQIILEWHGPLPWPHIQPRPYCAIICSACKEIIGYEHPPPYDEYCASKIQDLAASSCGGMAGQDCSSANSSLAWGQMSPTKGETR
jgi:hypothetical protein